MLILIFQPVTLKGFRGCNLRKIKGFTACNSERVKHNANFFLCDLLYNELYTKIQLFQSWCIENAYATGFTHGYSDFATS
jgi:hypothetical protein